MNQDIFTGAVINTSNKDDHLTDGGKYEALLESYQVVMAALMAERRENERLRGEAQRQAAELDRLKGRLERMEGLLQGIITLEDPLR